MAGIFLSGKILFKNFDGLKHTTLATAGTWSAIALQAWVMTWIADRVCHLLSAAVADYAWYICVLLSLCPPIAVLGSRRPGTRVWNLFILCPMLLVLGWPVASLWLQSSELRGVHLENPQLVGLCLVLIMGVGNYCGTRHTVAALLYGGAVFGIAVSFSSLLPRELLDRPAIRFWCSCLMIFAILSASSSRTPAKTDLDQLWFDFFDTFGIVWGRRIQDRVNFQVSKERLPVRLELDGFQWSQESSPSADSPGPIKDASEAVDDRSPIDRTVQNSVEVRLEQIFRWLLRRFVDAPWIDQRLKSETRAPEIRLPIDS